ncbi:hypothetical protein EU527_19480 [Candidatus Thorarchaeota archaeon]|nr:MAG: hypothetical protein EU527_19480 [Candidatus Thorarchaeota archaeon]
MYPTKSIKLPQRDTYTVRTFLNDLKKLRLTPSTLDIIGTEIVYFEFIKAQENLGEEDPVTIHMDELLNYMQHEYERQLLAGEIRREEDTPSTALNTFLKETPLEFRSYVLERPGDFIRGVLHAANTQSQREMIRLEKIEVGLRKDLEKKPENPDLWFNLHLVLWITGRHEDASKAFKKAKKNGWDKKKSKIIGI